MWPLENDYVRMIRAASHASAVSLLVREAQHAGILSPGLIDAALNRVELLEMESSKLEDLPDCSEGVTPPRAEQRGSSPECTATTRMLLMLCMRYMRWLSIRTLRTMLRTCFAVGVRLARAEQRAAMQHLLQRLPNAGSQDVANIMWALGSAPEWELQQDQVVRIIHRAAAVSYRRDFILQTSSNIFLGLVRWQARCPDVAGPTLERLVADGTYDQLSQVVVSCLQQAQAEQQSSVNSLGHLCQEASLLVHNWGVLGREPLSLGPKSPLTSVMAWLVEVLPSVPSMERMRSVSTTLYGLSRLYYLEGAPLPPHLQSLVAKLVALAAQPERRMQRSSATTSLAAAPADLPLQLSSASIIAVSLGIMGMEVREGSWQGLLDPVLAPRPGVRMNPERCSQLLMGLAVVGQRSQLAVPAAVRILADLLQAVEETPLETLSRASWSAALIQGLPVEPRLKLLRAGFARAERVALEPHHHVCLKQLHQARLVLEADGAALPDLGPLAQEAAQSWQSNLAAVTQVVARGFEGGAKPPTLHGDVSRVLDSLGVEHSIEQLTADSMMSIDIAIGVEGRDGIALEVDGPYHYTTNTLHPTGRELARNRLLKARGWTVVVVPAHEWGADSSFRQKQRYLRDKLREVGCEVAEHRELASSAEGL